MNYSIHFHVWDTLAFLSFLAQAKERYSLLFKPEIITTEPCEMICILRKTV